VISRIMPNALFAISNNKPMSGINLRDLAAFAAIAQHRSFRRAAKEFGVSVSTLSERLRALEEQIGARLLNRSTRSVAPTEAGDRLLVRIAPALREIGDAAQDVATLPGEPSGRLRINAPAPAVQLVLAPMIAPFLKRYPKIALEIVDDPLLVDIVAAGFDAGVRYEEHLARDMVAISLGPRQRYVVVAAPRLLAERGIPKKPRDLLGAPCIVTRFPGRAVLPWEFERAGRVTKIVPEGRLTAINIALQLRAAIGGLGFLATFDGYTHEAIASGELQTVLDDWSVSFPGPFLYYPSRRQNPSSLDAFIAFVKEWRASEPELA
jgi:DNA-binding transcriptional LysR family regulator